MEKTNVIVSNLTGSSKIAGELYLVSGVIRQENGEFVHLSKCHQVIEVKIEVAKEPEPAPVIELKKEEVPKVEAKRPGRPKKKE